MNLYDFSATRISGDSLELSEYRNKLVIVVNTASKCGFTSQYEGLEQLYQKYKEDGLVILGFPCNQFGKQEPGTEAEIQSFCSINFGVTFPLFAKVDVNGKNTHPLFDYLKKETKGGILGKRIKWNFTKFIVDRSGKPVGRFGPTTTPNQLEKEIQKYL